MVKILRPNSRTASGRRRESGTLLAEAVVAMAVIAVAMLPIMGSYAQVQKSIRLSYQRAVAMELIDGEMEILLAGEWREFQPGAQPYALHGGAAGNLPPGKTMLTLSGNRVRLEWQPDKHDAGGTVIREGMAK